MCFKESVYPVGECEMGCVCVCGGVGVEGGAGSKTENFFLSMTLLHIVTCHEMAFFPLVYIVFLGGGGWGGGIFLCDFFLLLN